MTKGICKICESFFDAAGVTSELCPTCYQKEKEYFEVVKTYLLENKGASILEISTDTGIPLRVIKRLIESEKIEFMDA